VITQADNVALGNKLINQGLLTGGQKNVGQENGIYFPAPYFMSALVPLLINPGF
jgi:hypothetical protein